MSSGERARDGDPAPSISRWTCSATTTAPVRGRRGGRRGAAGAATSPCLVGAADPHHRHLRPLGKRLARRSTASARDRYRPSPLPDRPKDIQHHQFDIRRKKTQDVFRQTPRARWSTSASSTTRAPPRRAPLVERRRLPKLLEFVAQFEVPKLVVLSSANVYGPQPDNAQFLPEEAPLLGGQNFSDIRDLIEVDMLAQSFFWKRPDTETLILRPVHILGTREECSLQLPPPPVRPHPHGLRPDGPGHPPGDVVRAIQLALRPAFAASSTSPAPSRSPSRASSSSSGGKGTHCPSALAGDDDDEPPRAMRLTSSPPRSSTTSATSAWSTIGRARDVLGFQPAAHHRGGARRGGRGW